MNWTAFISNWKRLYYSKIEALKVILKTPLKSFWVELKEFFWKLNICSESNQFFRRISVLNFWTPIIARNLCFERKLFVSFIIFVTVNISYSVLENLQVLWQVFGAHGTHHRFECSHFWWFKKSSALTRDSMWQRAQCSFVFFGNILYLPSFK